MRFFLDNCLAIRHARALDALLNPEHRFVHLQEKFKPDTKDVDWLRELGGEKDWIVISGDYRIGKSAHEKAAWRASRLTAFFLAKGWMNLPLKQQHSKLSLALDDILFFASGAPAGSGFLISIHGKIQKAYDPA